MRGIGIAVERGEMFEAETLFLCESLAEGRLGVIDFGYRFVLTDHMIVKVFAYDALFRGKVELVRNFFRLFCLFGFFNGFHDRLQSRGNLEGETEFGWKGKKKIVVAGAEAEFVHLFAGIVFHHAFAKILFCQTDFDRLFDFAQRTFSGRVEMFVDEHGSDMVIHFRFSFAVQSDLPVR